MAARDCSKNAGFLSLSDVPEDLTVVGAVIITMNDAGEYGSIYLPESLDHVPAPEVQETQGGLVAQAFEIANLTGLTA